MPTWCLMCGFCPIRIFAETAAVYGERSEGTAVHPVLSTDGGVSETDPGPAGLPDTPLCGGREELLDDCIRLHRGKTPVGDDGGVAGEGTRAKKICHAGRASRHR